jgi:hypothetical protein
VIKGDTPTCIHERLFKVCGGAAVDVGAVGQGLGRIKAKETVRATFHDKPSSVNSLPRGTTVNSARYIVTLRSLTAFLRQVRLARKISEMQLLCDNARPHTSFHFTERLLFVLDGQCYRIHPTVRTIRLSPVLSHENTITATRNCTTLCGSGVLGTGIQAVFQNLEKTVDKDGDCIAK